MTLPIEKVPPHNLEAERDVLACCLVSSDAAAEALDALAPDDFYNPAHQVVFRTMAQVFARGEITLITLWDELKPNAAALGLSYGLLVDLAGSIPTTAHLKYHLGLVAEHAALRRLARAGASIVASAMAGEESSQDVMGSALGALMATQTGKKGDALMEAPDLAAEFLDDLEALYESRGETGGRIIATGFYDLDNRLTISAEGDLIILAARPGMGKTAKALCIARNVAEHSEVLIHSLEMSRKQLWQRLIAMETGIELSRLRRGMISAEEWGKVHAATAILSALKLTIDDRPAIKVGNVMAAAKRQAARGKAPSLIMVDYLQLMTADDPKVNVSNRVAAVSQISGGLKRVARETDSALIALSQLSRAVESRTDKRPMLSDLRESGSIEQDADSVIFIYRDDYYAEQEGRESKKPGTADVIIAKQRAGASGVTVELYFDKTRTKFENARYEAPEWATVSE